MRVTLSRLGLVGRPLLIPKGAGRVPGGRLWRVGRRVERVRGELVGRRRYAGGVVGNISHLPYSQAMVSFATGKREALAKERVMRRLGLITAAVGAAATLMLLALDANLAGPGVAVAGLGGIIIWADVERARAGSQGSS